MPNRFSRITPVNFRFSNIPMQLAVAALQAKEQAFNRGRDLAESIYGFTVPHLPQDKELVESTIGKWRDTISEKIKQSGGDYSSIYGELRNIRADMMNELRGGNLYKVSQKYQDFTTKYKKFQDSPDKYDQSLANMWYNAYMNPKSPLYYKGIAAGGEYQSFMGLSETPNLHQLALEAIKALPKREFGAPGILELNEKGEIKSTSKDALGLARVSPGLLSAYSTKLEFVTPESVKSAVMSAWVSDPRARTYLDQYVQLHNASNPDSPLDLNKVLDDMSSNYLSYAYVNKLIDVDLVQDPSYKIQAMKDLYHSLLQPVHDFQVDYLPKTDGFIKPLSTIDLVRISGKYSIVPRFSLQSPTGLFPTPNFNRAPSMSGKDIVKSILSDPNSISNYQIYKPLAELVDKKLGPNYTLKEFVKEYNSSIKELGGMSVNTMRRFDLNTSKEFSDLYLTQRYVANASIYKVDKNGKIKLINDSSDKQAEINKFYDNKGNRTGSVIGITTPSSGIDPSFVAVNKDNEIVYIGAPSAITGQYQSIVNLISGAKSPLGESMPTYLPVDLGNLKAGTMVKSKATIRKNPTTGIHELFVKLYKVDENGETPINIVDNGVEVNGLDLLNEMGKMVESATLPLALGKVKGKNLELMDNVFLLESLNLLE